jgi:hypothetical protein
MARLPALRRGWKSVGKKKLKKKKFSSSSSNSNSLSTIEAWERVWSNKINSSIRKNVNKRIKNKYLGKFKTTSLREIELFLATRIRLIYEKNTSMKDHWKRSKGIWNPKYELTWNRWRLIHQNLGADISKIFKIFNQKWSKAIKIGSMVVMDELLAGSNVKSPVRVYIPRKPHPNGHLYYFSAVRLKESKKWYVINVDPYLKAGERPTFSSTFSKLLDPIKGIDNLNVVADNKFCTLKNIDYCITNSIEFTTGLAMNT